MVQTLSGSWYLWLVPLFVICVAVMIPASLNELGMTRKARKEEAKAKAEAKQSLNNNQMIGMQVIGNIILF